MFKSFPYFPPCKDRGAAMHRTIDRNALPIWQCDASDKKEQRANHLIAEGDHLTIIFLRPESSSSPPTSEVQTGDNKPARPKINPLWRDEILESAAIVRVCVHVSLYT